MRRTDRGFTLVELMVVVLISLLGFLALLHLQTGINRSNTNAWNLVSATYLGEHLIETVRMEALEWTNDASQDYGQSKFHYLKALDNGIKPPVAGYTTAWQKAFDTTGTFRRVNQVGRLFGTGTEYDAGIAGEFPDNRGQLYCVHYRLAWVIAGYLARLEVRVLWPRMEGEQRNATTLQSYDTCPLEMVDDVANVYGVTLTSMVMKNVFVNP